MTSFWGRHNPFNHSKKNLAPVLTPTKGGRLSPHNEDATCRYQLSQAPFDRCSWWMKSRSAVHIPAFFFNHMFSITPGAHGTNSCCNSIRIQRGRSRGWDSRALSRDSWVTGVSLGPQSTQWLLCTCQSSCDTGSLPGGLGGDASRGERGERSSTTGQPPHRQVTHHPLA